MRSSASLAIAGLMLSLAASAQDPIPRWQTITAGDEASQLVKLDFDGDGRRDIAVLAYAPFPVVRIFGTTHGGWLQKQVLTARYPGHSTRRLAGWDTPAGPRLAFIAGDGGAIEFGDWPLRELRRFAGAFDVTDAEAGDIDADGVPELLVSGPQGLVAIDTVTLQPEWTLPSAGGTALAQLDADAALEIILAGTGQVIDGATRLVEWDYPDPFGVRIAAGRFGEGGEVEFAGSATDRVVFYRAEPYSPVWEHPSAAVSISAVDVDADGLDELLFSNWFGDVRLLDPRSRQVVREWIQIAPAARDVDFNDFHGDGTRELIVAGGSENAFRVVAASGATLFTHPYVRSPFLATVQADVDQDGRTEVLIASAEGPATLRVLDAASGKLEWEMSGDCCMAGDPLFLAVRSVLVGQLDADPSREIVLVGAEDARVVVIDAATRSVQSRVGTYAAGPFLGHRAGGAALADLDGDGVDDLVLGTWTGNHATGARLRVLPAGRMDGAWETVGLGTPYGYLVDVLAIQSDADAALEIVAVLQEGLRAFDADTRLLDWSLPVPVAAIAHDAVRGELFIADGSKITVYSDSTRAFARDFDLAFAPQAMTVLPGDDLVAILDASLCRLDAHTGAEHGRLDFVGPPSTYGLSRLNVSEGLHGWHVVTSTELGHGRHEFLREPFVFHDGFGD
jgi:hypothetical protein